MKLNIAIPTEWQGLPVTLLIDPNCEALIWSKTGEPLQGITGGTGVDRHIDYILTSKASAGQVVELWVEVACNGMFGTGDYLIGPPDPTRYTYLH